jgi:hypothetical protein
MALPSNIGARKHGSLSIAHGVGDGEAPWFPALPGQIVQRTFLEANHMPVEYVGFMLKPDDFLAAHPAMEVAAKSINIVFSRNHRMDRVAPDE